MDYKAKLKEALLILARLQDIIESNLPDIYYKSDEIAKLNDFWVDIETDPELENVISNL